MIPTDSNCSALVVEGGAMRSIFSAGLLDSFLENKFNPFDFYIGVSAGAFNLATYLAGKPKMSLRTFEDFALRKEFISYTRFVRGGHLLDLDWLLDTIFSESQMDLETVYQHKKPLYVCVTDVSTGKPIYINTSNKNLIPVIKASTALPLLYRRFPDIDGRPMTDGGIAEGIPVAEAIRIGAKKIMVVRSRPKTYLKQDTPVHRYIRWKLRRLPMLTAAMRERVKKHKDTLDLIRNPPNGIKIMEICPPEHLTIGRFSRNRRFLLEGYEAGYQTAEEAVQQWLAISHS